MTTRILLLLALAAPAMAQTPAGVGAGLTWDQPEPTLTDAQALVFDLYVDAIFQTTVSNAVCTGSVSPFTCQTAFPALMPGIRTVAIVAVREAGAFRNESTQSEPLAVLVLAIPLQPAALRIERLP